MILTSLHVVMTFKPRFTRGFTPLRVFKRHLKIGFPLTKWLKVIVRQLLMKFVVIFINKRISRRCSSISRVIDQNWPGFQHSRSLFPFYKKYFRLLKYDLNLISDSKLSISKQPIKSPVLRQKSKFLILCEIMNLSELVMVCYGYDVSYVIRRRAEVTYW